MYSEYPKKQEEISYYPISKKFADVILRKNEASRQDEDGQIFYIYDEIQFKTNIDLKEIESNFEEIWMSKTKNEISEEEKLRADIDYIAIMSGVDLYV